MRTRQSENRSERWPGRFDDDIHVHDGEIEICEGLEPAKVRCNGRLR